MRRAWLRCAARGRACAAWRCFRATRRRTTSPRATSSTCWCPFTSRRRVGEARTRRASPPSLLLCGAGAGAGADARIAARLRAAAGAVARRGAGAAGGWCAATRALRSRRRVPAADARGPGAAAQRRSASWTSSWSSATRMACSRCASRAQQATPVGAPCAAHAPTRLLLRRPSCAPRASAPSRRTPPRCAPRRWPASSETKRCAAPLRLTFCRFAPTVGGCLRRTC